MRRTIFKYLGYLSFGILGALGMAGRGEGHGAGAVPVQYEEDHSLLRHCYSLPELYGLIDSASNIITDTVYSLDPLMEKLLAVRSGADSVVSILHIGDSHVQAGYWTSRIGELIQADFGDSGRGLVIPYKLASGNEPRNYAVKTTAPYVWNKATDNRSGEKLGFTGVGISFASPEIDFEIWSKEPFNSMTLFHHETAPMLMPPDSLWPGSYCTQDNTLTSTHIALSETADTVVLKGAVTAGYDTPTFYGFSLENGRPGVLYHAIGSNGAAFEHFREHTTVVDGGLNALAPDLIIVSLGTNNCYGRNYRSDALRETIGDFAARLKQSYPGIPILMTSPRESCRRTGRRCTPNPNIQDAAAIISGTAAANGLAFWDLYDAAGGKGVSEEWFRAGLVGRDRIHFTEKGYEFLGDMFYEAFARYYNDWLCRTRGIEIHTAADSTVIADSSHTESISVEAEP